MFPAGSHGACRLAFPDHFPDDVAVNMARSTIERYRRAVSGLVVALVGTLALLSASRWDASHVDALLFAAGCVLVGISSIGRLWCTLYIAGMKTRVLVSAGPYSMCRNPLYFFSMLGMTGIGLATETFTIAAILLVAFALYYPYVIRSEQDRLAAVHGEDFARYRERVSAFIPRFSTFREPATLEIDAPKYRRAMFDALWFVWLLGFLEIAEALRDTGILPTVFHLY